jgi:hypothetical protein
LAALDADLFTVTNMILNGILPHAKMPHSSKAPLELSEIPHQYRRGGGKNSPMLG